MAHNRNDAQNFLGPKMLPRSRGEWHECPIVPLEEAGTKPSYLPGCCAGTRIISDIRSRRVRLWPSKPWAVSPTAGSNT